VKNAQLKFAQAETLFYLNCRSLTLISGISYRLACIWLLEQTYPHKFSHHQKSWKEDQMDCSP